MKPKRIYNWFGDFILGTDKSLLLEEKMLIAAIVIGFFTSLIGGLLNFQLGYSIPALIIPLVLCLLLILLFYFVRIKRRYSQLGFPFVIFAFTGIGVIWINNGGYNGTNTIILLTTFVLGLTISPNNKFTFLYFYFIILLTFLHFFHYFFPEKITQFPNEGTRFTDTILTVIYSSSFIYLMLTFLIKNFRLERQKANDRGKKLEELNEELEQSNISKDKLFSIIAHDLKSPFNTILGFSELSLEQLQKNDLKETEKSIQRGISSAQRTLILLENLLTWAKTQSGQFDFKPEKLSLRETVQEVCRSLELSAKLKNIKLDYNQFDDIEANADKNMLQTIMRNLISNAVKFTRQGGYIIVKAEKIQHYIEISVSDNGIGMNQKTLDSLFRIATNKSLAGTANEIGSGLGLILCKDFIELHGGTIRAESEEGNGSRFVFTIPVK